MPRLARSGRPVWSGGLGALGTPAAVGAAAATSTAVGTRGQPDVESHCQWLGILEQRSMDSDLTGRRALARELSASRPSSGFWIQVDRNLVEFRFSAKWKSPLPLAISGAEGTVGNCVG